MAKTNNDAPVDTAGDEEKNRDRQFKIKLGRTVKVNDKLKIVAGDATVSFPVLQMIKGDNSDALLAEQEVTGE